MIAAEKSFAPADERDVGPRDDEQCHPGGVEGVDESVVLQGLDGAHVEQRDRDRGGHRTDDDELGVGHPEHRDVPEEEIAQGAPSNRDDAAQDEHADEVHALPPGDQCAGDAEHDRADVLEDGLQHTERLGDGLFRRPLRNDRIGEHLNRSLSA